RSPGNARQSEPEDRGGALARIGRLLGLRRLDHLHGGGQARNGDDSQARGPEGGARRSAALRRARARRAVAALAPPVPEPLALVERTRQRRLRRARAPASIGLAGPEKRR